MKSSKSKRNVNQKKIKSDEVVKVSVPLQSVVDHQSQENMDFLPDDDASKSQKEGNLSKNVEVDYVFTVSVTH